MIVDDGTNCGCDDFTGDIDWSDVCGFSNGEPGPCEVSYHPEFNCDGNRP